MFSSGIFKPVRLFSQPVLPKTTTVQRRILMQPVFPHSGPQSHETLRKRFMASARDPKSLYSYQRQEEARDKGQFVYVHDITDIQPSEFDLISNITHETPESTISQDMGINYLSKAEEPDASCVIESATGYIRRSGHRALIPLVVNNDGEARWLFV